MDQDINNKIQGFLQYIFEMVEDMERISKGDDGDFTCSKCGITYSSFKKSGKIGCGYCYRTFRPQLTKALSNIHGSGVHKGKIPQGLDGPHFDLVIQRELKENRILLKQAVDREEYEEAARLRDIIQNLELSDGSGGGPDEVV